MKDVFDRALKEFSQGLYHKALSSFNELTAIPGIGDAVFPALAKGFRLECYKMLAIKYASQELPRRALRTLEEGLHEFPHHYDLLLQQGIIYNNSHEFPAAVRILEEIAGSNPDFAFLSICLAIARLNMGQLEEPEQILKKLISPPPHDATVYYLLSILACRRNRTEEAGRLLGQALELKKPFPDAQIALAAVLILRGQYPEALQTIQAIMPFERSRSALLNPLAFLLRHTGTPVPHEEWAALLAQPSRPEMREADVVRWAGELFLQFIPIDILSLPSRQTEGEFSRHAWFRNLLVAQYQRMVLEGTDRPDLFFRLGRELQRLRKVSEALIYFKRCLARNPKFISAKISMAYAYLDLNEAETAMTIFQEVRENLQIMPELEIYTLESAIVEPPDGNAAEQYEKELKILSLAVSQHPYFADLYDNIGRIFSLLDQPEMALEHFEKAIQLNPHFFRAKVGKAISLMQINRHQESKEILDSLEGTRSLYSKVTYQLALVALRQGMTEKAREWLLELTSTPNEYANIAGCLLEKIAPAAAIPPVAP